MAAKPKAKKKSASAKKKPASRGAAPSGAILYGERELAEGKLENWPNPQKERPYLIEFTTPEFTCLCPRSGFPDFATIHIRYVPKEWIVELKSLKLYINRFRNRKISHESTVNEILDDLVALLKPRWMEVIGDFNVRGNIHTVVTARHGKLPAGCEPPGQLPLKARATAVRGT